jgi:hypothetical protein
VDLKGHRTRSTRQRSWLRPSLEPTRSEDSKPAGTGRITEQVT